MKQFGWAANPQKLARAIAIGKEDESAVKAAYIEMGGLVKEGYPETVSEPVMEEVQEEKPKKVAKKTKK